MKGARIPCIITGNSVYFSQQILAKKISKFGTEQLFREHYISVPARKLLRKGKTVDEIREELNVTEKLPKIDLNVLSRLKLLKKKRNTKTNKAREERQKYLNSKEFIDKMTAWEERQRNMSFQDWVEKYTGTGRERGGTCVRPDIFLSWNNRACDGCQCYEFCMCYGKRLSGDKKKPRGKRKR